MLFSVYWSGGGALCMGGGGGIGGRGGMPLVSNPTKITKHVHYTHKFHFTNRANVT